MKGCLDLENAARGGKKKCRLVILGEKDPSENSGGMNKTSAFKAIGKTILPDEFALDGDAVGKRVRLQYEHHSLTVSSVYGQYKKQLKRLLLPWSVSPSPVKVTVTVETPIKVKRSSMKENHSLDDHRPKVKKETPLSEAILRARQNIKKIPAKRSLEETLITMHESTMKQAERRAALQDLAQRRLMLDEKAQLIEMQRLGIYTKEEFIAQLAWYPARTGQAPPSFRFGFVERYDDDGSAKAAGASAGAKGSHAIEERWLDMDDEEKEGHETDARFHIKKFLADNEHSIPPKLRRLMKFVPEFLPECAYTSHALVEHIFTTTTHTHNCVFHSIKTSRLPVQDNTGLVTGVPYPRGSSEVEALHKDPLELRHRTFVVQAFLNFTGLSLDDLYEYKIEVIVIMTPLLKIKDLRQKLLNMDPIRRETIFASALAAGETDIAQLVQEAKEAQMAYTPRTYRQEDIDAAVLFQRLK
ncbi:hypothetical protein B0H14DRAFT_2559893 [Mycena olivaceomarginata]|nr:hypothetical protein B0H14DRAFT_2559893 [Mycena olivaceomarginata]